ncbi:MAG: lactonase family protein [Planctomycetaceae bacterium]|jgi:6-phosphogluconolactonase|nr:lactonase family protein [Planctomycetaceae bacterium]
MINSEFFYWIGFTFFTTFFLVTGQAKETQRLFIGTYTGENGSQGIYTCQFDPVKGTLSEPILAAKCEQPSFLAIHPTRPLLYAVAEQHSKASLYAFTYQKSTGELTLLDEKPIPAQSSCHLCLCRTPNSEFEAVVVANYTSGNLVSFPIFADGKIGEMATNYHHTGSGPNTSRQKTPHPHAVYFDNENKTIAVPDLGIDRVMYYDIDLKTAVMTPKADYLILPAGGGPRHLAVSQDKRFIYVNNELSSTVCVFETKNQTIIQKVQEVQKTPKAQMVQEISTLPEGVVAPNNSTAEIELARSGRFLYVSNRGDDSIAVFAVEPRNGQLSRIQNISSGGKHPRFFTLDPSGHFLLSCNMETNNIDILAINPENGMLTPTPSRINVSRPVCIVFAP